MNLNVKKLKGSEFRTPIEIRRVTPAKSNTGYSSSTSVNDYQNSENIFGSGFVIRCRWVNAHGNELDARGNEALSAKSLAYVEVSTITFRSNERITSDHIIYRPDTKKFYEIIGIDNIRESNSLLELKIKRVSATK